MTSKSNRRRVRLGSAIAALALGFGSVTIAAPANAQRPAGTFRPSQQVLLSLGEGQMVRLPSNAADVWTSNPEVADVYVASPKQIPARIGRSRTHSAPRPSSAATRNEVWPCVTVISTGGNAAASSNNGTWNANRA